MENSTYGKLLMYLAVKSVCEAKPAVWRYSEAFTDAYRDFCECIENILRSSPSDDTFSPTAKNIPVEYQVADTILTTELDELIERFERVDVAFVDDYTAARSTDFAPTTLSPAPVLPAS